MMQDMGPCGPNSVYLHMFLAVLNVLQSVALGYLAQRAGRKDRTERRRNGNRVE